MKACNFFPASKHLGKLAFGKHECHFPQREAYAVTLLIVLFAMPKLFSFIELSLSTGSVTIKMKQKASHSKGLTRAADPVAARTGDPGARCCAAAPAVGSRLGF